MKITTLKKLLMGLFISIALLGAGCDDAGDDVEDAAESAADTVGDGMDEAGDAVEGAAEEVEDEM